jgi:hypothetical protein
MSSGDRVPCVKCGALNYVGDDFCVGCGHDFLAREPARSLRPLEMAVPGLRPVRRWWDAGTIGVVAVLCSLAPVAVWGLLRARTLPAEGVVIPLAAVAWFAGLVLGVVTIWRGERALGVVAVVICLVQLVLVVGWVALCVAVLALFMQFH